MTRWIKIYQSLCDHWIWENPIYLQWWIDLLFMANWEERKYCVGGIIYPIKKGQLVVSYSFLTKRWRYKNKGHICTPSPITVKKFLSLLEMEKMINIDTSVLPNHTTLVTICNYQEYQEIKVQNDKVRDSVKCNKENKNEYYKKFDFSVYDESYMPAIIKWLDYKKSRHESYKNDKSLQLLYKKMLKIGSPEEVMEAIENSISNNYSGLFAEKKDKEKKENLKNATDIIKEIISQRKNDANTQGLWHGEGLFE